MAKKKIEETKIKGKANTTSKSKKESKEKEPRKLIRLNEDRVTEENVFEYARRIMLIYGANVNIARSIPNGLDGLKPVERRILYTMYKFLGMRPGKGYKKLTRVVGETMGLLHP